MTFRKAIGKLHLWLGLASGLIVLIVSLSGAVFVFQDEIRDLTQPWRKVAVQARPMLPPSVLQATAAQAKPGFTPSWTTYNGSDRSTAVYLSKGEEVYYAFLNPYTGQLLKVQNLRSDFFTLVQYLHMYLLLPPAIGKWVVDVAVITFVVMLISGIVLWWPRNKAARKQRFSVKWDASPKRRNYDLHNVLGFYASAFALVLALTGLCISYEWLMTGVGALANGGRSIAAENAEPTVDTLLTARPARPVVDIAYTRMRQQSPQAEMLLIGPADNATAPVWCTAYGKALHYYHRDEYRFHPRTGQLLLVQPHASKSNGKKLADMNYDLHTGLILGFGGKVIAFVVSLVAASMPVTGVVLWWGRRHKAPRRRPALATA
ncbi:PepSY-associated TM helix domain-containing protein [Hymenobacter ginsengisoli]|uniref:PepSY-associated TM helix domain-containing protein n=1 Tax=Hymenobacter ginsengisoli TaxID=1051626 RepID=A0ABP8PXQ1_9BACT|nr:MULTISPECIES: PepSY-associated TM helix domain-containing protein [unclassified Hymenobacter]MBO2030356.1 PepSY domain-containing protein [Hymenobacter sp. BT559]